MIQLLDASKIIMFVIAIIGFGVIIYFVVKNFSSNCPTGKSYNKDLKKCTPTCGDLEELDSTGDNCVCISGYSGSPCTLHPCKDGETRCEPGAGGKGGCIPKNSTNVCVNGAICAPNTIIYKNVAKTATLGGNGRTFTWKDTTNNDQFTKNKIVTVTNTNSVALTPTPPITPAPTTPNIYYYMPIPGSTTTFNLSSSDTTDTIIAFTQPATGGDHVFSTISTSDVSRCCDSGYISSNNVCILNCDGQGPLCTINGVKQCCPAGEECDKNGTACCKSENMVDGVCCDNPCGTTCCGQLKCSDATKGKCYIECGDESCNPDTQICQTWTDGTDTKKGCSSSGFTGWVPEEPTDISPAPIINNNQTYNVCADVNTPTQLYYCGTPANGARTVTRKVALQSDYTKVTTADCAALADADTLSVKYDQTTGICTIKEDCSKVRPSFSPILPDCTTAKCPYNQKGFCCASTSGKIIESPCAKPGDADPTNSATDCQLCSGLGSCNTTTKTCDCKKVKDYAITPIRGDYCEKIEATCYNYKNKCPLTNNNSGWSTDLSFRDGLKNIYTDPLNYGIPANICEADGQTENPAGCRANVLAGTPDLTFCTEPSTTVGSCGRNCQGWTSVMGPNGGSQDPNHPVNNTNKLNIMWKHDNSTNDGDHHCNNCPCSCVGGHDWMDGDGYGSGAPHC
jgi:hypothetical protein